MFIYICGFTLKILMFMVPLTISCWQILFQILQSSVFLEFQRIKMQIMTEPFLNVFVLIIIAKFNSSGVLLDFYQR